jgi:predicted RNA-binding Zn-ribbon protein involved in translation (DUF1610 family)
MTHKANLREHCLGVKPVISKQGKWWKVTCPGCGKTVAYRQSECEAKQDWNAQMECAAKMKGHEDE